MTQHVLTFDASEMLDSRFNLLCREKRMSFFQSVNWHTTEKEFKPFPDTVLTFSHRGDGWSTCIYDGIDFCLSMSLGSRGLHVEIATAKDSHEPIVALLKAQYPFVEPPEGSRPVHFWNLSPQGPKARLRTIEIQTWNEIHENYAGDVQEALEPFISEDYQPTGSGKLILWRGLPGTGKTWALRSLIHAWRKWATFHYIVDPDALFGSSPDYLLQVTIHDDGSEVDEAGTWRVLILEDAGELLAADAKQHTGQGLSRLLNLVDGLVGQGLRILVLVTTNEELGKLNAAVSRAGRCLMNLEFSALSHQEVLNWTKKHNVLVTPASGRLADLYAAKNGVSHSVPLESVGFTR